MPAVLPSQSIEYLRVPVTASVTLDTQPVEMALTPRSGTSPTAPVSWETATWTGLPGTTRTARLLIGPLTPGTYDCWVKVDAGDEIPVRVAGLVTAT
jgi:hypothetical protein